MQKTLDGHSGFYLFLLILIFAFWNAPNNFFWRDDWFFLTQIKNQNFHLFSSYAGHIKPVFKAFYWVEANVFGTVSILYLYTNLLLHFATCAALFYFLKEKTRISPVPALVLSAIVAVHPVNFNTLLWTFQSSQLLQLLFQFLAVIFFIRFIEGGGKYPLAASVICLVIQNYCFGNGLLMPVALLAGAFFVEDKKQKRLSVLLMTVILVFFLGAQLFLAGNVGGFSFVNSARAVLYYQAVNLFRYFFIKNLNILNPYIILFLLLPLTLLALKFKSVARNPRLVIYLFWYGGVSVLIPVARNHVYLSDFPAYYSFASFLPFCLFLIELFKDDLTRIYENGRLRYLSAIFLMFVSLTYFLVDRRMAATFSYRNYRNEMNMARALTRQEEYVPFDDPYFQHPDFKIENPKDTYLFWRQKSKFNFLIPALTDEAARAEDLSSKGTGENLK